MRRTHQRPSWADLSKNIFPAQLYWREDKAIIENSTWNWKGNSGFQRTCVTRRNWWWLSQSFYGLQSCELADTKNHGWSFSCDGWSETWRQLPCLRPALSWCHKTPGPDVSQSWVCNKEATQLYWEKTRPVSIFYMTSLSILCTITKQGK